MGIEALKNALQSVKDFWANLSKTNKVRLIMGLALVVIAAGVTIFILTNKTYRPLITVTNSEEATGVKTMLEEGGIPFRTSGYTILVEEKQYDQAYFNLLEAGIPKSGSNYEVLTSGMGFGQTDKDKDYNRRLFERDEIRDGLEQMEFIDRARVIITKPTSSSYVLQRDQKPPTASIILVLARNKQPSAANVKAVESYVMKSVEGLTAENISIIDSMGNQLNRGDQYGSVSELITTQLDVEQAITDRFKQELEPTFDKLVGMGNYGLNFNVSVSLEQNQTESESFEAPNNNKGILRSTTESSESQSGGTVDVGAGLDPNGVAAQYPTTGETSTYESTSRQVIYDINRILQRTTSGPMRLDNASVAVSIDSNIITDRNLNGETIADQNEISDMVSKATGIPVANVSVKYIAFEGNKMTAEQIEASRQAAEAKRFQELLTTAIIFGVSAILLVLLMVLAYRALTARERLEAQALALAQADLAAADFAGEGGFEAFMSEGESNPLEEEAIDSIRKHIEDFIRKDPESVANLLKVWLYEEENA